MEFFQSVRNKLQQHFPGGKIEVEDESAAHASHNPDGAHLAVSVRYAGFAGKSLLEQHRMVQEALAEELRSGKVHALKIRTETE